MKKSRTASPAVLLASWCAAALLPVLVLGFTRGLSNLIPLHTAARVAAVTAFAILFLQPVIAARFKWIERTAGLDRIFIFHRISGAVAAVLAFLHPLLLALGSRSGAILFRMNSPWQITAGKATLVILFLFGGAAVFRRFLRIPFQRWFRLHNFLTPVILAGVFLHSWFTAVIYMGSSMKILWFCFLLSGLYSYLHLSLYQRLKSRSEAFSVSGVRKIVHRVWEISLVPPNGEKLFPFFPGQFLFITLLRERGLPVEEHPFSISSAPEGDTLSITVKELGDYTSSIGKTRKGSKAAVMAPYGRFSYLLHPMKKRIVFIAGGIGITPVISMLRHMKNTGEALEAVLFYGNRTEADIAFRLELDFMSESAGPFTLRTVNILSRPVDTWKGERGRINGELIKKHLGTTDDCTFFICGPPGMMNGAAASLLLMGVDHSEIHMEKFSL